MTKSQEQFLTFLKSLTRRERRAWYAHWVHHQIFVWSPPKRVYHLVVRQLIEVIEGVQE